MLVTLIKNKYAILLKNNKETYKFLFLFLVVLTTILIHILAINKSSNGREIIWEPDDQYHELVKAKNLDTCKNDCLAINNLSSYEIDSFNLKQKGLMEILIHHTEIEYHFVKSKILIFINSLVKDWELSQIFLSQIVSSLLVISFAVFILVHFNLNICLISSILILPYTTIVWGFHFSNSSSHLSSVFGIFSLIFLYKLKFKNYLISLFFTVFSIFTHPVGIVMTVFNTTFIIIKNKFSIDSKIIGYLILIIITVMLYFNLDFNYTNKDITFLNIYNEGFNLFDLFIKNLKFNAYFFYDIFNLLNFVILFAVLLFLNGSYNIILKKYPGLLPLLLSLLTIIIISFFHFAPQASVLMRMQLILTLSILSIYSVLIYEFFLKIKKNRYKNVYLAILAIIFCSHSYYNLNNLSLQIKSNQETLNLSFNINSINELKKNSEYKKLIIFKKIIQIYLFLNQFIIDF